MSCRVASPVHETTPFEAYSACFDTVPHATKAELVQMTSLVSGDVVLTSSESGLALDRVVVNQHTRSHAVHSLLTLHHSSGYIECTPDHVLLVDGIFVPARHATIGSKLSLADGGEATIERVVASSGGIINPVTTSGTILAAGQKGLPIIASTHPEWSAEVLLANPGSPPLFHLLAKHFPHTAQSYYETVIEPVFDSIVAPYVVRTYKPSGLLKLPILIVDAVSAIGFIVFACSSNLLTLAAVGMLSVAVLAKKKAA